MSRDLYTFFRSSTSYRLRIALAYKRLEYKAHYVSLPKMEHRTSAYRELHAQGLVPLLIDSDRSFIQSMAMIEYLDEVYPEPPLMPGLITTPVGALTAGGVWPDAVVEGALGAGGSGAAAFGAAFLQPAATTNASAVDRIRVRMARPRSRQG